MIWEFNSPKYGKVEVLVDDEFDYLKDMYYWYIWTTPRHNTMYVVGQKKGTTKTYRLHRVICGAKDPSVIVDHKNGNGLDNRLSNLRVTDSTGNNRNARKRKNSTSIYKGVSKKRNNTWSVQIQISKDKYIHRSGLKSEEEAARLYNELATKYHGEFALLNEIKDSH